MKNRRILAVKENDSFTFLAPSTTTTLSDKAFPFNTFNQSILFSSFPHFSLLNSSNDSSTPENPYGNPYDLSARMNPSIGIIIVILLSAFFFLGIFSIYVRRCGSGEDNTTGNSRRGGGGNGRMNRASQGLDKNIIETFPVFNYSLVKGLKQGKHTLECAVCLSEFEDDEALRLLPKCNHAFHPDCIDMWLFSHTTCPLCRSSLLPAPHGIVQGLRVDVEGQPQQRPLQTSEQVVVVIGARNALHDRVDNQGRVTNEMISFDVRVPSPSVGQARVCNEHNTSDTDSPIRGIMDGKPREKRSQNFRRSHSTGHSLVRLGGNPEHPSEFYISTDDGDVVDFAENLIESSKSDLHRSISYAAFCHTGSPGFSNSKAFVNSRERLWRYTSSTDEACRCFNPCSSTGAEAETGQEFGRISQNGFDPRINL